MDKLRRLYTAALLSTFLGLLIYGFGKVFFVLAFRTGQALLLAALLSLPALALLAVGFVVSAVGTGLFIALTAEQRKQPEA